MTNRCLFMLGIVVIGLTALAQEPPPVVRIPGRADSQRPGWTAATSPQAIEVQDQTSRLERSEPPVPQPYGGSLPSVPVGAILAWAKSMTNTPPLPAGWLECNGQVVGDAESPYVGQAVPDINGANGSGGRFLRGAEASGAIGGSTTHVHDGYRSQKYGTQRSPVAAPTPANHLPPFYDVVWIMRIK